MSDIVHKDDTTRRADSSLAPHFEEFAFGARFRLCPIESNLEMATQYISVLKSLQRLSTETDYIYAQSGVTLNITPQMSNSKTN